MGKTALHVACGAGKLSTVEVLLSYGANVYLQTQVGYVMGACCQHFRFEHLCFVQLANTPLHVACDFGHFKIAELLLQNGANHTINNWVSVLILCG